MDLEWCCFILFFSVLSPETLLYDNNTLFILLGLALSCVLCFISVFLLVGKVTGTLVRSVSLTSESPFPMSELVLGLPDELTCQCYPPIQVHKYQPSNTPLSQFNYLAMVASTVNKYNMNVGHLSK